MIATPGTDGTGHRLESAISCIAVAEELGLEFIVIPVEQLEHVALGDGLEMFKHYPHFRHFNNSTMVRVDRVVGGMAVEEFKNDWTNQLAEKRISCLADGKTVYEGDNCWPRFWRHTINTPVWPKVQRRLQTMFTARLHPVAWFRPEFINVVIHARQKDAWVRIKFSFYSRLLNKIYNLHKRYLKSHRDTNLGLKFWIHSNDPTFVDLIQAVPNFYGIHFFDSSQIPLHAAMDQMLIADLFVTSYSSLSMFVALIGGMQVISPRCGSTFRPFTPPDNWHVVECDDLHISHVRWPPTTHRRWVEWRNRTISTGDFASN